MTVQFPPAAPSGQYIEHLIKYREGRFLELNPDVPDIKNIILKNFESLVKEFTTEHLNEEQLKYRVRLIKAAQLDKNIAIDSLDQVIAVEETFLDDCVLPTPSDEEQKFLLSLHERGALDLSLWTAKEAKIRSLRERAQESLSAARSLHTQLEDAYRKAKAALEPAAHKYEKGRYLDSLRSIANTAGANFSTTPCVDRLRDKWFPDAQTAKQKE